VASLHRPVLISRFAPVTLSSSGAVVSEAQPHTNQATASTLIMIFMDCSARIKCKKHVISLPLQSLAVTLRVDCGIGQSCYKCDLSSLPTVFSLRLPNSLAVAAEPPPAWPAPLTEFSAYSVPHTIGIPETVVIAKMLNATRYIAKGAGRVSDSKRALSHHRQFCPQYPRMPGIRPAYTDQRTSQLSTQAIPPEW
jgi:hypothetical protein